jgi:hypothetical protein
MSPCRPRKTRHALSRAPAAQTAGNARSHPRVPASGIVTRQGRDPHKAGLGERSE